MAITIPTDPITVELDPETWDRGDGYSMLRSATGSMCCWGFAALAMGATVEEINLKPSIFDLDVDAHFADLVLQSGQYAINDTRSGEPSDENADHHLDLIDDELRVERLNDSAKEHALPVRFVLKGMERK